MAVRSAKVPLFSIISPLFLYDIMQEWLLYMIDSFGNANEILSTLFNLHFSYEKNRNESWFSTKEVSGQSTI